jgi:hypothetical protein
LNLFLALREEARVLGAAIDSKLHALNKYATTGKNIFVYKNFLFVIIICIF